jgi:hypothetical protein
MPQNDLTELQTDPASHLLMSQVLSRDVLQSCRNHLEALQNLRYLILLEAHDSQKVKLHLRMMDWHLNSLGYALSQPDTTVCSELQ